MRHSCHFLLMGCIFLLAACHTGPISAPVPHAPAPVSLEQLVPPAALNGWQLQGNISQGERMHVYRYLNANQEQVLDLSLYPLPDGWQDLPAEQALNRHFGMLAQQLGTSAQRKYQAERVDVADPHVEIDAATGDHFIDARFTSHFADNTQRITLVSLSLCQGNFLRLTSTVAPEQADGLATQLATTRQTLSRDLCQVEPSAPRHD